MHFQKSICVKISVVLLVITLTACGYGVSSTPVLPTPMSRATQPQVLPTATLSTEPAAGFPPQPEGVPFPTTDSWPEGEWPSGVDQAVVDEAADPAFADGGPKRVRAVVIIYGGKLIYERYSPNAEDGPGKIMPSYSIAKSFTSALVGILVRDGKLDVDAPAPVPAWSDEDDLRGSITPLTTCCA